MNPKKLLVTILTVWLMLPLAGNTPEDSVKTDTKQEKIKKGWTFGGVPAVSFNTDLGFQYGLVLNFFNYGDGKTYPKYHHNIYLEWSKYTKGSGKNILQYDSEYLIPGIRLTAELAYLTDLALDFYGFNGYESSFNKAFRDDEDTSSYISRMFYAMDRKLLRGKADFQGPITGRNFRWLAGFEISHIKTDDVDIEKLNKGKDEADKLPDADLLFGNYKAWGLIPEDQWNGGTTTLLKLGAVYDTRDAEANPMKGLWTEFQLLWAPSFLGNGDLAYTRAVLTHRQYFTLFPKVLSFVYRLSYQGKLTGEMPFYMLPFAYNTAPDVTRDAFGGNKTIRGVMRNRVVGDGVAFGNMEFRWKFYRGIVLNQNVYLALSTFLDGGMVTNKYKLAADIPSEASIYFQDTDESLHLGYGGGLHIALNENFIVAADVAKAVKEEDAGGLGVYIGLNWLF